MQRSAVVLGWALALQLALALALFLGGSGNGAYRAKEPLLAFDASTIDGIDIDETGGSSVSLTKAGGTWSLPSFAGFPADGAKVAGLLSKLAEFKRGWPVATSADAASRFKVTDDSHERRIVLKKGGKAVAELLIGASPLFRQAYARANSASSIYNIAFGAYDAADRAEDWMIRDALGLPEDKIASISIGDVTLDRKDGKYVLSNLADGETPKESEISKLVSAALHPAIDAVQGKGADALGKVSPPDIEVTVKLTDGTAMMGRYKKEAAGGAYIFSRSGSDYLFRASETSLEPIIKAKHAALVDVKPKESAAAQPVPPPVPAPAQVQVPPPVQVPAPQAAQPAGPAPATAPNGDSVPPAAKPQESQAAEANAARPDAPPSLPETKPADPREPSGG